MSTASEIDAVEALAVLARETGGTYRLVGRLGGGETGAHQVVGPAGQMLVIKWDRSPKGQQLRGEAVVLSERLRIEAAWPVPGQVVIDAQGYRFVIQEFMSGGPVTELSHRIVEQILDLHAHRLGIARQSDPIRWPTSLVETLTVGGQNYCLHSSLRDHDERTRSLVVRIETFGNSIDEADLQGNDVVHWDLHPGNLLVEEGSLSGIVDTDFALVGDARFDLVTLAMASLTLRCESGVRSRLFAAAFDELDEVPAQMYLAHLFLRLLDWPIRKGRPDEIEFWLARSDEMLNI